MRFRFRIQEHITFQGLPSGLDIFFVVFVFVFAILKENEPYFLHQQQSVFQNQNKWSKEKLTEIQTELNRFKSGSIICIKVVNETESQIGKPEENSDL